MKVIKSLVKKRRIKSYGYGENKLYWQMPYHDEEEGDMLIRYIIGKSPRYGGFKYIGVAVIKHDKIAEIWVSHREIISTKLLDPNMNKLRKLITTLYHYE